MGHGPLLAAIPRVAITLVGDMRRGFWRQRHSLLHLHLRLCEATVARRGRG
jgi:hypothetical protein